MNRFNDHGVRGISSSCIWKFIFIANSIHECTEAAQTSLKKTVKLLVWGEFPRHPNNLKNLAIYLRNFFWNCVQSNFWSTVMQQSKRVLYLVFCICICILYCDFIDAGIHSRDGEGWVEILFVLDCACEFLCLYSSYVEKIYKCFCPPNYVLDRDQHHCIGKTSQMFNYRNLS